MIGLVLFVLLFNLQLKADPCFAEDFDEAQGSADLNLNREEILIIDGGIEHKIKKVGNTVKEVLNNAQIEIYEKDIIFPSIETVLHSGTNIIIERAIPITLNLYGKEQQIFTQKKKVSEALAEQGIELKEGDLINVDFEKAVFPEIEIKIWQKPKPKEPEITKTGRTQIGIGSWYSFIPGDFCASTTFKKGTKLLVTNLENGRQVTVTVNDYGPVNSRIIDLEKTAFAKLASPSRGVIKVRVEELIEK